MICLYNKTETDFSHNGVCVLEPSVCTVSEETCGSYELYMEYPFDIYGKYTLLAEDMVIRAPVPHQEIPQITLPEKTLYTVNREVDFYIKLPLPKHKKKDRDALELIRANPSAYQWSTGRGYNAGSYCVYSGGIYQATQFTISETPGLSGSWRWVAALYGGGGGSDVEEYTPGETYRDPLVVGSTVMKLADYSDTIFQIRDQIGRVGYVVKSALTIDTVAPETLPAQTIDTQLFRIYSIESEEETSVLHVYARHISYDFAGNAMMDCKLEGTKIQDAIAVMQGRLMVADTRRIACQFEDDEITKDYSFKNPVNALLDPDDGIVKLLNAKLIRNNHDFYILRNDSNRIGPRIEYGINLKGVNWSRSAETVITRVVPRCKTGKDDHLYLTHGGTWDSSGNWIENDDIYVESAHAADFPVQKIQVLDCAYSVGDKYTPAGSTREIERTEASCRADMLADAQKRFTEEHCDGMEITLSVEFLLLGETEQYKQYKGLQYVNLYDVIPIKTEIYEAEAQVTAYEYDAILGRYNSIEIGNVSTFNKRIPGFRVVNESITYAKLSPELISMIRTMGATGGDTTGSSGGGSSGGSVPLTVEFVDNLISTKTDAALSANQGRVLNEAKAEHRTLADINGSASKIYNVENGSRIILSLISENTDANSLFLVACSSTGSMVATEILCGPDITVTTSTANQLYIANAGSQAVKVDALVMAGNIT